MQYCMCELVILYDDDRIYFNFFIENFNATRSIYMAPCEFLVKKNSEQTVDHQMCVKCLICENVRVKLTANRLLRRFLHKNFNESKNRRPFTRIFTRKMIIWIVFVWESFEQMISIDFPVDLDWFGPKRRAIFFHKGIAWVPNRGKMLGNNNIHTV